MGVDQLITEEMVDAAAKAMYAKTRPAQLVIWDLLPSIVQHEMRELALAALLAAEPLRGK